MYTVQQKNWKILTYPKKLDSHNLEYFVQLIVRLTTVQAIQDYACLIFWHTVYMQKL